MTLDSQAVNAKPRKWNFLHCQGEANIIAHLASANQGLRISPSMLQDKIQNGKPASKASYIYTTL